METKVTPFETARTVITVTPEHKLPVRDVTPPEALMIKALHWQGSNASPLATLEITGQATTEDSPARAGQAEYFDPNKGCKIPAVLAVAAKTHLRTNAEEISRLKRKYTAIVNGVPAFDSVFGKATIIHLPKTFAEVAEELAVPITTAMPTEIEEAPEVEAPRGKQKHEVRQTATA